MALAEPPQGTEGSSLQVRKSWCVAAKDDEHLSWFDDDLKATERPPSQGGIALHGVIPTDDALTLGSESLTSFRESKLGNCIMLHIHTLATAPPIVPTRNFSDDECIQKLGLLSNRETVRTLMKSSP